MAVVYNQTQTDNLLGGKVPTTRQVAGKPLSDDVIFTKADVGLGSVDNTSDAAKPVSTAQQAALDAKVPTTRTVAGKALTGNITLAKTDVGLANVDNTSDVNKPVSTATATALGGKADLVGGVIPTGQLPPLAINETFTATSQAAMLALTAQRGDVAVRTDLTPARVFILTTDSPGTLGNWVEITAAGSVVSVAGQTGAVVLAKADVGLANVDNTSDASKPVSTAQQTALDAKVPTTRTVAGKALSGDVTLVKADVGLSNVDNTSDANKPVSTATATALAGKVSTTTVGLTFELVDAVPASNPAKANTVYIVKPAGA